ncbi:MAG: flavin reductase family protein [Methanomassiliicoccales archaeon]|jgi:flavin reductase (DIM6/NTAB) family NADH-FMN oxidoreductase RutF
MKKSLGATSLLFPTPALLIGTYDKNGRANAMTAAWAGISCSNPPCISVSLRKATYSYGNIKEHGAFTVNVPSEDLVEKVDYFGLISGRDVDKFAATGLTPMRSELVDAPYIEECPLVLECKVVQTVELGLHTQFVGEIEDVKVSQELEKGSKEGLIGLVKPLIYAHDEHSYWSVGKRVAKVGVSIASSRAQVASL